MFDTCVKCGGWVAEKAARCFSCGYDIQAPFNPVIPPAAALFGFMLGYGLRWARVGPAQAWAPLVAVAWAVLVSAAAFVLYWGDKIASLRDRWRASENKLLWPVAVGGAPGAWAAMRLFRHKTRKPFFRARFRLIVAIQAVSAAIGTMFGAACV